MYHFRTVGLMNCILVFFIAKAYSGPVAEGTFESVFLTDLTNGDWTAQTRCPLSFPSISLSAYGAYILTRFDVQTSNYVDYLSPSNGIIDQDHVNHKWVIEQSEYPLANSHEYTVQFDYSGYLPTGPNGTCHLYDSLSEAQNKAQTSAELFPDTIAKVLGSCQYSSYDSWDVAGGELKTYATVCTLTFTGSLGQNQGYVLVTFPSAVVSFTDTSSYAVEESDTGNMWFLVKLSDYITGSLTYSSQFNAIKSTWNELDLYDIVVSLYANKADALADATGK